MSAQVKGVGLGLRFEFAELAAACRHPALSWLEVAPENYVQRGGTMRKALTATAQSRPIVTHGLAMSLGGPDPLDVHYMREVRAFCADLGTPWHSDHLCFSAAGGVHSHELLPIPFREDVARYVADRIRRAQDLLGLPLAIENISAYATAPGSEMGEGEFLTRVVELADCMLLLDINNVYVNSVNMGFDARARIAELPLMRVVQLHVAGHEQTSRGLLDTHAAPVSEAVFELLGWTLPQLKPTPILLERDGNFPDFEVLLAEVGRLADIATGAWPTAAQVAASSAAASSQSGDVP
jgi:uncharacterized protein